MNILYMIGNGFDMNLHIKTGYQDFYDEYISQSSDSIVVRTMKSHLERERYGTWADLEKGLGEYTSRVSSIENLEEIAHDLTSSLKAFLLRKQDELTVTLEESSAFFEHVQNPGRFLQPGVAQDIQAFINSDGRVSYRFISFNYTKTIERMLAPLSLGNSLPIRHIHMTLDDDEFIMGVNDDSQISNKSLLCEECRDLLVKPHINRQLRSLIDNDCVQMIANADLICMFGLSIGETDQMWWEEVGKRMRSSKARLLLFAYDKDNEVYNNRKIRKVREYTNLLMGRFNYVQGANQDEIRSRIFVGYKTDMFKIK